MRLRRLAVSVSLLGLAGILFVSGYVYLLVDEPPPDDADLLPTRRDVPETENGFWLLKFRTDEIDLPEEGKTALQPFGPEWSARLAQDVLEKNAEALKRLDHCLGLPEFQAPERGHEDPEIRYVESWSKLLRLASIRVFALRWDGREKEAFEEAIKVVRLGRRIERSQGTLLQYLMAHSFKKSGADLLRKLLVSTSLRPADLGPYFEELPRSRLEKSELADVIRNGYQVYAEVLDRLPGSKKLPGGWTSRLLFHPNQTRRMLADLQRQIIRTVLQLEGGNVRMNKEDLPQVYPVRWYDWRNREGLVVLRLLIPSASSGLMNLARSDLSISAAEALYGVKCFHAARGELPTSLADLVPAYLKAVPADPYDGKPFRYSREKKVLYSVGEDLIDSGASTKAGDDEAEKDWTEPTFRIPF